MIQHRSTRRRLRALGPAICALAVGLALPPARAEEPRPVRVGVVTFLSGLAAGPFGVPARNAAEILAETLNEGSLPPPYQRKGLGGARIELVFVDEAGGPSKQEAEFRELVPKVDVVVGYISSADCLAIAPLAEQLKKLTLLFDCGTPRIFEERDYTYVFRPVGHATMDSVGAALYAAEMRPKLARVAGINQNYSWGVDSWNHFEAAIRALKPNVKVTASRLPALWAGRYGADLAAIRAGDPEIVHSSFWGSDLDALMEQAGRAGLSGRQTFLFSAGETLLHRGVVQVPDGTMVGGRGPNGFFAPDSPLNAWFVKRYKERYWLRPSYPSYHMAQALLGLKAAYEKAQESLGGATPSIERLIDAFAHLTFDGPSGLVKMALGKGHQAVQGTSYGRTKTVDGVVTLRDIRRYPAEQVNPPDGIKSEDWIRTGLKVGARTKGAQAAH